MLPSLTTFPSTVTYPGSVERHEEDGLGVFITSTKVNGVEYAYLDKPVPTQTITRRYTRLDNSLYIPKTKGWENTLYYLNIKPTFRKGFTGGAIRPRLVRADGDMSMYDDIEVHADCLDDDGIALKTRTYWEHAAGTQTYIELKCIGGLESAVIGTRYTKKAIVP